MTACAVRDKSRPDKNTGRFSCYDEYPGEGRGGGRGKATGKVAYFGPKYDSFVRTDIDKKADMSDAHEIDKIEVS